MTVPERDLHPTEGARFLLQRLTVDGDASATYRASIYTPERAFHYHASLRRGGEAEVVVEPAGPAAPAALEAALQMIARLTARSSEAKAGEGLPPWPARVLRWRGPGRGK